MDETGYETEAIDILFHIGSDLQFRKLKDIETRVLIIVKELLNEAFNLFLTDGDCKEPAFAIYNVIKKS